LWFAVQDEHLQNGQRKRERRRTACTIRFPHVREVRAAQVVLDHFCMCEARLSPLSTKIYSIFFAELLTPTTFSSSGLFMYHRWLLSCSHVNLTLRVAPPAWQIGSHGCPFNGFHWRTTSTYVVGWSICLQQVFQHY
jgi:hypothetical protein